MAQRLEVYKCNLCGNVVEVLTGGAGALVCCGQDMVLMSENTVDAAQEKHVFVLIQKETCIHVSGCLSQWGILKKNRFLHSGIRQTFLTF